MDHHHLHNRHYNQNQRQTKLNNTSNNTTTKKVLFKTSVAEVDSPQHSEHTSSS